MSTENTPNEPSKSYDLTPPERAVMQSMNQAALNAKARIYDLQAGLEQARADLNAAAQAFNGAITVLANAHGMSAAGITPDFARIVAQ